jgi:antitoxin VapB
MALNIKDPTAERLAAEAARLTGETKTGAIRTALAERIDRLSTATAAGRRKGRLRRFLEEEAWPAVPRRVLGRRVTKTQRETILGYGKEGV